MKFYSFDEIRAAGNCAEFARSEYGAKVSGGRCNAAWRGGDGPENVSIDKDRWHDHVRKVGGGIIELAAQKFNGDKQRAQEYLGNLYGLTPKMETGAQPVSDGRYDKLIRQGYKEVKRYGYYDLDGNLIHYVSRLEHPSKPKEFCQGNPKGWGVKGIDLILYNLAGITNSEWCCIVEGEKAADILIENGIPATTCCGGANKWHSGYASHFIGKRVAILPDNDEPGRDHAKSIAASLLGVAADVRIVQTSPAEKGDVYDYLTTENKTIDNLMELIGEAKPITASELSGAKCREPDSAEIKAAKEANSIPFRNFIPVKHEPEEGQRRRNKGPEIERKPRIMTEMIKDCHRRFLGFPRKVGESQLFDHDRDTGRIVEIHKSSELFSWIGRKSKHYTDWARGDTYATKDELMAGLSEEAIRYESISLVPDWPMRDDVYYAHQAMPPPCSEKSRFEKLVNFFSPATDADKTFLKALFISPLWYEYGIPKPSWIVDSEDGAGTGKTTIAEAAAALYMGEAIRTNKQELRMGVQELIKRLISSRGRSQRILLVDNITGQFSCPELADLITAQSISGRAPYGRGEETRPNNIVTVITANTATVDNDLADRSYYINIRKPERNDKWRSAVMNYIDAHRFEIIADIISILENKDKFQAKAETRFPEFETHILQPLCSGPDQYAALIESLKARRSEGNVEDEHARAIEDMIRERLADMRIHPDNETVFIRTPVLEMWMRAVLHDKNASIQLVRNLAKMGLIKQIDSGVKRYPHNGNSRRSGVMWNNMAGEVVKVLNRSKDGVEVILG